MSKLSQVEYLWPRSTHLVELQTMMAAASATVPPRPCHGSRDRLGLLAFAVDERPTSLWRGMVGR